MKTELEICAYTLEACEIAQQQGADRVELCSAVREGGLSPTSALIRLARVAIDIDIFVMIRPRGGDFLYTENEFKQMCLEIEDAKKEGANGIVIGLLNADGTVDKQRTQQLVNLAHPMEVTFHRAFDMVSNPEQALEDLIEIGCKRILTSGCRNSAPEGINILTQLVIQAKDRIKIMAGAGVNAENVSLFINAGVHAVHLSGSTVFDGKMEYRNPNVCMSTANTLTEYQRVETDSNKVKAIKSLLQ